MKSKEVIKGEIVSQMQQQSIAVLLESLTEAIAKIAELEGKLAEASKPQG